MKIFEDKIKGNEIQVVNGNFLNHPEKFADMKHADGILLWGHRDQSKYSNWEKILIALNALERNTVGIVVE